MFLLPFIFAGVLILTVLNPPYIATMVSQSVSHYTPLLSSTWSRQHNAANLLPAAAWDSEPRGHRFYANHFRSLPSSPGYNATDEPTTLGLAGSAAAPNLGLLSELLSLLPSGAISEFLSIALDLFVVLLWLLVIRGICTWVVYKFRVPQPASPAMEFVESLQKRVSYSRAKRVSTRLTQRCLQVHGQAFTPSNSCDSDIANSSDDEDLPSPIMHDQVKPEGILYIPMPPLETIRTIPLRLHVVASAQSSAGNKLRQVPFNVGAFGR